MSHRSFGDRLRSARHREGMTQAEVADRIGTSSTLVCKWETGVHVPYKKYAHAIRQTLGIDLPPTHDRANEVDPRGFGILLRRTRKGAGLSQYDLADRVGVHQSTISNWELGYSTPDHAMIVDPAVEVGDPLGLSRSEILEAAVEAIRRAEQGTLEMDGPTADEIISTYTGDDLQGEIRENVDRSSEIMTDDFPSYRGLDEDYDGGHFVIKHSDGEYVRGDVHTNTAESFFALLKRGINGAFHHVSDEHLHRYCDEFTFRWKHRDVDDGARTRAAILGAEGKRLMYEMPVKTG